ncbi:Phosphoglycolate phosphatase [Parasaccharibacter apium]|uniref:phosphoglycolate phosphatase n=2 Tax=Acetobacteraceae TaxID=433 RepID=A0A7U7G6Y4_9PROT|nr:MULTISPECIES: HAD family hydrolase [Acetobacteraceae]MBE1722900.1 HAD family hydrolase [Bombella apis]MBR9730707.1 HAD family hydrolase [Bombella apis]MCL1562138.1 HAD family hydrolase [Parasaccharibacter sp. TMW 2.1886]CDG34256.1 Phosphoglycolate phosphatase [Parasaccharibacter apium]
MLRYPILLLDYDGTLAETRPAILRSLEEAFTDIGRTPPPRSYLKERLGKGDALQGFYQNIVDEGASMDEAQRYVAAYRQRYAQADEEETYLYDGAHEVLQILQGRGYRMIAVSNKHGPTLRHSLARFQLEPFFEASIGAEEGLPRKPEKEVFTQRLAHMLPGWGAEQCLMVGDTTADIGFAQTLGMDVCWASYGHGVAEVCREMKPTYQFDSLWELPNLLSETES